MAHSWSPSLALASLLAAIIACASPEPVVETSITVPVTTDTTAESNTVVAPTTAPFSTSSTRATPRAPDPRTYLVWASGGLDDDFVANLQARFEVVSIVKGGTVELGADDGWLIPLEGLGFDRAAHEPFDQHGLLTHLRPGAVVLGATSAQLRSASPGDVLTLGGTDYEVAAVVPDEAVAHAEVAFSRAEEVLAIAPFALIQSSLSAIEFEQRWGNWKGRSRFASSPTATRVGSATPTACSPRR